MQLWTWMLCLWVLVPLLGFSALFLRYALRGRGLAMRWHRMTLLLLCLLWALLLMRPHQHSFQGLDASAYRLMAHAFAQGTPASGVDHGLRRLPLPIRRWVTLSPDGRERLTRDRSFEILSLKTAETRPFFFPVLPLCMVGLDQMLPFDAMDYFVPLTGLIVSICLVMAVSARMGAPGGFLVLAFLIGSPLPAWLFRGCITESVSAALLGLVALHLLVPESRTRLADLLAAMLVGLSISFHPVMVLPAALLMPALLLLQPFSVRRIVLLLAAFAAGVLPVVVCALTVTFPYGTLSVKGLRIMLQGSGAIPVLFGFVILATVFAATWGWFRPHIVQAMHHRWLARVGLVLFPLLCILPVWLVVHHASYGMMVTRGLDEAWQTLHGPYAIAWLLVLGIAGIARGRFRERMLILAVAFMLPVFLYLKGAERMQLWSMRRLIVPFVLLLVPALLSLAAVWDHLRSRALRLVAGWGAALLFGGLCLVNPIRWPAPLVVRFDHGADAWVKQILQDFPDELLLFDYHPYSIPFAVYEGSRVFAMSENNRRAVEHLLPWVSEQAATSQVVLVSAYSNPGLEEGMVLQEVECRTLSLPRVRTSAALPAEIGSRDVAMRFLRATPVPASGPLVVDKVFDDGRSVSLPVGFAVRGPWGPGRFAITASDGTRYPARWSVQGSRILGPVPAPGEEAGLFLIASNSREPQRPPQELLISPPWDGEPLSILVPSGFNAIHATFTRPASATTPVTGRTGFYTLRARVPYDPAEDGIRGFSRNLGALIHRIRISVPPAPVPGDAAGSNRAGGSDD